MLMLLSISVNQIMYYCKLPLGLIRSIAKTPTTCCTIDTIMIDFSNGWITNVSAEIMKFLPVPATGQYLRQYHFLVGKLIDYPVSNQISAFFRSVVVKFYGLFIENLPLTSFLLMAIDIPRCYNSAFFIEINKNPSIPDLLYISDILYRFN